MASPLRSPSQVVLAFGLLAVMALLAALQWTWIGQWGAVEETRLESNIRAGAQALDEDLTRTLYDLAGTFRDLPAEATPSRLAARFDTWQAASPTPGLVVALFFVEPGPTPRLFRVRSDAAAFEPTAWPDTLAPWRTYIARFPAALAPETPRVLRIDDAGAPDRPLGLVVPTFRPEPGGPVALRFTLALLDPAALRDTILPALIATHLVAADQFDVLVTDAAGGVTYRSRPGLGPEDFTRTDLDRPLGPEALTRLTLRVEDGEINLFEEAKWGEASADSSGRWRLRVRHQTGSIGEAVSGLRHRQLALAFGVLLVLGLAVGLLVRSAQQARRLAQRQMDFVAGVSHELRTPLAVIRSAGENLADGVVDEPEQTRRYGALVRDEGQRLSEMVENVLALAGADAHRPTPQALAVEDLVAEAFAQAQPLLDAANVDLAIAIAEDTPMVVGDRASLVAALRNLLANAARYGGTEIVLRAEAGTHAGRRAAVLTVHDDGPGLDPADLPHLFEPFYRGRAARDAQQSGSGLGLALVRRAAEAHGGAVTARNGSAGGSVFTLTLIASAAP